MKYIKIPEGADTLMLAFNGEMSKMDDEQREAMKELNDEANRRLSETVEEVTMNDEIPYDMKTEKEIKAQYDPLTDTAMTPLLPKPDVAIEVAVEKHVAQVKENLGITNSLRYTQDTLADEFARIFKEEIMALRNAGQKEYAHDDDSPFANFERGADDTGMDRKQILWVYCMKHKDGIAAALKGHTSQREDVRGRINDMIVYLLLMRGMYNEEFGNTGNFGLGALEK